MNVQRAEPLEDIPRVLLTGDGNTLVERKERGPTAPSSPLRVLARPGAEASKQFPPAVHEFYVWCCLVKFVLIDLH